MKTGFYTLVFYLPIICIGQIDPAKEIAMYVTEKTFYLLPDKSSEFNELYKKQVKAGAKFEKVELDNLTDSVVLNEEDGTALLVKWDYDLKRFFLPFFKLNQLKQTYGAGIWEKILQGNIQVGWTKNLVEMSRGRPLGLRNDIELLTAKTWEYTDVSLSFKNGRLTKIIKRKPFKPDL